MGIFFLDSRVERFNERHGSRFALLDRGAGSVDGEEIQFHALDNFPLAASYP